MVEQGNIVRRDSQIRRAPNSAGLYDVLDLILDKGIVIDAFVRVSLVGIELLTVDLRVVVASVDTYLRYAEGVERLQWYNRDKSVRLPEMVGKMGKGRAIGRNLDKVTDAITGDGRHGRDDDDEAGDREGAEEHEGVAGTLAKGVRRTVGRLVDSIAGGDEGDDDDQEREQEQPERERREAPEARRDRPRAHNGRHAKAAARR